jgi:dihydropteroate synthase
MTQRLTFARLGRVKVGDQEPVAIMGVINISPESFFQGSVCRGPKEALSRAERMLTEGAKIIDLGGMSTAPYKDTMISQEKEVERVVPAIRLIKKELDCVVSIDTQRSKVAQAALEAGADIVNDVSGLRNSPDIAALVRQHSASLVVAARAGGSKDRGPPIYRVIKALRGSLDLAASKGVELRNIVVDPGIGFFRNEGAAWYLWDLNILSNLFAIKILGRPLLVGVSRKSFIGEVTSTVNPESRLPASLAVEGISVALGADVIRTHSVGESYQASQIASRLRLGWLLSKVYTQEERKYSIVELSNLKHNSDFTNMKKVVSKDSSLMWDSYVVYNLSPDTAEGLKEEISEVGGNVIICESGGELKNAVVTLNTSSVRRLAKGKRGTKENLQGIDLILNSL